METVQTLDWGPFLVWGPVLPVCPCDWALCYCGWAQAQLPGMSVALGSALCADAQTFSLGPVSRP